MSHSPRPWHAEDADNGDGEFKNVYGGNGQFICGVFTDDEAGDMALESDHEAYVSRAEAMANLALILAAPKMADVLREVLPEFACNCPHFGCEGTCTRSHIVSALKAAGEYKESMDLTEEL